MSKIRNKVLLLFIALVCVLGCVTISLGADFKLGARFHVWYSDKLHPDAPANQVYEKNNDMFCIENGRHLDSKGGWYKINSVVKIKGLEATGENINGSTKTWSSQQNAILAYILAAENDNKEDKADTRVANAVWAVIDNFVSTAKKNGFTLGVDVTNSGFKPNAAGKKLVEDAKKYAQNISSTQFKSNTDKSNVKAKVVTANGRTYTRVGPFNWSFSGKVNSITVKDSAGRNINSNYIRISKFNGTEQAFINADGIVSGKNFYVYIDERANVSGITSVSGTLQNSVKSTTIYFLDNEQKTWQPLIVRDNYGEEIVTDTYEDETPLTFNGNLKVVKVNADNESIKLEGVGFKIKNKETGKYVHKDSKGNITYVNENQATEFVTDSNGEILIKNLTLGTYVAYETKNPNYGYEIVTDGQEQTIVVNKTTTMKIANKQKYIKLSGYVWVDKQSEKQSIRNDLYKENPDYDDKDILLDGVTVRLKDRTTGQTVKETTTKEGTSYTSDNITRGIYLFEDVETDKLANYYIEFEYDGLTYTNVIPHIDRNNGSKAAEDEQERDTFNKGFSVVEGRTQTTGFTRDENGNEKHQLLYNFDQSAHTSTLINNGQYLITSNTDVPNPTYIIKDHFTYGMEEIKYINLGLYEREQPDLALVKDLENVKISVNGKNHVYEYAQRFSHPENYGGEGFNVGVKFGEKYGSGSYKRAIYEADYEYVNEQDKDRELKVYVTYRIAIRNESTNLIGQINSLVDYYDSRYERIVAIGTNNSNETATVEQSINYSQSSYNADYSKVVINTNTRIDPQTDQDIYVQFELGREAVLNILNGGENLDNVVEINSYSVFDENGKVYAGIDKDSNPGTCTPGQEATYEDDTDSSLSLKLEVADARELTGKVFLDSTGEALMTAQERKGSGQYEDGETGIQGVTVKLTENTGSGKEYTATTDENGDFYINGFIPGDYTLTYTWGDKTYKVQNYKATIYDSSRDQNNVKWYKEDVDTRKSDALDNLNTRNSIDEQLKDIKYDTKDKIEKAYDGDNPDGIITTMDSTTPKMDIGVEYETTTTASTGDRYTYRIYNVDFGIVERARQQLNLDKRVGTLKLTLANGQVVTDIAIDEEGNITGEKGTATYMGPSGTTIPNNGFVRIELDNELIQGATLEVGYVFTANNVSELDYINSNGQVSESYYNYGIVADGDKQVTISATGIIDYLDNDWAFDSAMNPDWKVITTDDLNGLVKEDVWQNENSSVNDVTILYTEKLANEQIAPGSSSTVTLDVSKILSTTGDISLDNETEITEVKKDGGSDLITIPGNYVPGTGIHEPDGDTAETVIVTPSTGGNMNYILPISVIVLALVVVGTGIIFIKKKILNK